MADHATVFYCRGMHYVLCYDDDLEQLPSPSRRHMKTYKLKPFAPLLYSAGTIDKTYVMRVVYKPEKTVYGRRPDGMVDRYVLVTQNWLNRTGWQFEAVLPGGLEDEHLLKSRKVEVLN